MMFRSAVLALLAGLVLLLTSSVPLIAAGPVISLVSAVAHFDSETVSISVWLDSLFEVISVTASWGDEKVALRSPYPGLWSSSAELAAFSAATNQIVVEAVDVFGNLTRASTPFRVDRPPVLRVRSPVEEAVLDGPLLDVDIVAEDDERNPQVRIEVSVLDATGTVVSYLPPVVNRLHARVALSGSAAYTLVISGYDPGQNRTTIVRSIYAGVNRDSLRPVLSGEGRIMDFTGSRVLFSQERDGNDPALRSFVVSDVRGHLLSRGDLPRLPAPVWTEHPARLADWGILLPATATGYELKDGQAVDLAIDRAWPMQVREGFAFWYSTGGYPVLYSLGTPGFLVPDDGRMPVALSAQRDVLLASLTPQKGLDLYLSRPADLSRPLLDRVVTKVTTLTSAQLEGYVTVSAASPLGFGFNHNLGLPATDGTNVAIYKNRQLRFFTPNGESLLANPDDLPPSSSASGVQVEGGWVAFSKLNKVNGVTQVWTRSPQGVMQQRTFFNSPSVLETLLPNGWLTYTSGVGSSRDRYLSLPGQLPVRLCGEQGRVVMSDGILHVMHHNTLFQFSPHRLTISGTPGSGLRLRAEGVGGAAQRLQSSSNLVDWVNVADIASGATFQDTAPRSARRYYRTIAIP